MSYIERTARKLFPILNELKKRMIPEKKRKKAGINATSVTGLDESDDDGMLLDLSENQTPGIGITKN
jgi:hypothetical protein